MLFTDKLRKSIEKNKSFVCVGLDPLFEKMPAKYLELKNPYFEFCKDIVDQTYDLVCAYKPQIAYFAAARAEDELKMIIDYINEKHPDIPVLLDSKRGDIGETSKQYAREAFERFDADAVTINPYMGKDAATPFLDYKDKGVIVLCKTSNPGSDDFQSLIVEGEPLYKKVAKECIENWNQNKNILLVIGATNPKELKDIRELSQDIFFLVPGIGAQGGDLADVLKHGLNQQNSGLIINSARGIIYNEDPRKAALNLKEKINSLIDQGGSK